MKQNRRGYTVERKPKAWRFSAKAWRSAAHIIGRRMFKRDIEASVRVSRRPRLQVESTFLDAEGKDAIPPRMADFPREGIDVVIPVMPPVSRVRYLNEGEDFFGEPPRFGQRRFKVERIVYREVEG